MSLNDRFGRMVSNLARSMRVMWLGPFLLLMAAGCYFDKEEKVENSLSFDRIADTLKQFDEVTIVLKKLDGTVIDVVYHDKVEQAADVHNLKAPNWDGGKILVSITGIKDGIIVYQVDTRLDSESAARESNVVVTPFASLSSTQLSLSMLVGDSLGLPVINVSPADLLDKQLEWSAAPDGFMVLGPNYIKASQAGSGQLTVKLKSNPAITFAIPVTISASGMVPQSISILPESLDVAAGGPPKAFSATVAPLGVSAAVTWSSADISIATVDANGLVQGKSQGQTRITATSQVRLSVTASAPVTVAPPIPVERIAFGSDSLEIFANGPSVNLVVSVFPTEANPALSFTLSDSTKATVLNGLLSGTAAGRITVIAASIANPAAKDTLIVRINGPIPVQTVTFARDSLEILVDAAAESLMVSVLPLGADPTVTFRLSDSTKASILKGKITGKAAGRITVTAASASNPAIVDELIVRVTVPVPNDTTPPVKPTVTVLPAGPTQDMRPVWSWKSGGGGGAGAYQISLDKAIFDSTAIALSDTVYKPAGNLNPGQHVLYVRERDAVGNWSVAGSAQVVIDTSGPAAPKVFGPAQTSSLPRWSWTSGGNGGAGNFRSRLGDANFPANAPESRDTVYALATAVSGTTYTLYVQERDLAGNWSAVASLPIKYDLTKPTVDFTAPQASGTFITASDTITIAGTATGPNAIAKVEYVLDAGTASPITVGTNGSWTLAALRVANAKTTTIKVTATDNLGNTGEAQLQILRDSDPPLPPNTLVKPSSPTNVAQSVWVWSAGADGAAGSGLSGKYRWKLNAAVNWTETNAASAPTAPAVLLLAEGTNTFSVQEQDKAGNWSDALTGTVVLDTKAPDAVNFVYVDGSYTSDDTPTWLWKPSTTNGGIGKYLAKLDAGAEFDLDTATSYTPLNPLSDNATHTLTVREKDQVPGVAGTAKTFSYKIKVNPPAAPAVKSAVAALPNSGLTTNPGFTWVTGTGGNGKYRVKVNTEASYRVNGVAQTTFSLAGSDADGTYTLYVSEQDDLGRYGPDGSFTIKLDRTPPVFANAKLLGKTYPLRDNFITNQPSIAVNYTADGASKSLSCNLIDGAAKLCTGTAVTDAAGNTATYQVNVWRRSNVVFFKHDGTGDGSSWEEAASDIQAKVDAGGDGKDFWLANGDYTVINNSMTIWGITLNIIGGFFDDSYPTNTLNRNKGGSTLAHISTMGTYGTWDGLTFVRSTDGFGPALSLGNSTTPAYVIDCVFKSGVTVNLGANVFFQNSQMIPGSSGSSYLSVDLNSAITWDGGAIKDNVPASANAIRIASGCSATFKGSLVISGNKAVFSNIQIENDGALVIANSVTISCADIQNGPNASGNCKGTVIVPGP